MDVAASENHQDVFYRFDRQKTMTGPAPVSAHEQDRDVPVCCDKAWNYLKCNETTQE